MKTEIYISEHSYDYILFLVQYITDFNRHCWPHFRSQLHKVPAAAPKRPFTKTIPVQKHTNS